MKKILMLVLILLSIPVFAIKYVSTSGNDNNSGVDSLHAWKTLQYADLHISSNDTIALKKGDIWSSNTALAVKHSNVIWDGSLWGSGKNAIIRSSSNRSGNNLSIVNIINCNFVVFKNIIIDGNNTQTFGLVIGGHSGYSGNIQNNEHHISILNCSILNCGNGTTYNIGFLCQTFTTSISDIIIKGCIFDGADDEQLSFYGGKSIDGGIPQECKNVYIGYNKLTNWGRRNTTTGYGLQINNKISNVTIEYNNLVTGSNGHGNGIHVESNETKLGYFPTNVVIKNNKVVITESNRFCLYISQGQAKTVDVFSNIFIQGNNHSDIDGGGVWITSFNWTGARLAFYDNYIKTSSGRTFQNSCPTSDVVVLNNNTLINLGILNYRHFCLLTTLGLIHSNNTFVRPLTLTRVVEYGKYKQTDEQVISWEPTAKFIEPVLANDTLYIKVINKQVIVK